MDRTCKCCGMNIAEEFSPFCGPECMAKYLQGRKKRICRECGKEFYTQRGRSNATCEPCLYRRKMAVLAKKKEETTPAEDKILKVIEEQLAIEQETGKRISYGELMARKG